MAYEVGVLEESTLRNDLLEGLFQGTAGREYWAEARDRWQANQRRPTRRFMRIVDEEYDKAVAAGPPIMGRTVEGHLETTPRSGVQDVRRTSAAVLLGLGAWVLLGAALRRQKN